MDTLLTEGEVKELKALKKEFFGETGIVNQEAQKNTAKVFRYNQLLTKKEIHQATWN